ncbi:MAG: hypothetical protein AABX97_09245 [Candidatus Thermoplasmatota archaeon]
MAWVSMVDLLVVASTFGAILFSFVVVPEILGRRGHDPRSTFARAVVWTTFLAIVLIPAAVSGFLFSVTNPVEWLILFFGLSVAILWEYYRLNPRKFTRTQ